MTDGMLLVLKPAGMTSHDVVNWIRRWTGLRRVGHAGTLDPMAEGLLPVLMGRATRLSEYMLELSKAYRAEVAFGVETDTDDAWGRPTRWRRGAVPGEDELRGALQELTGEQLQVPPMTSARRHDGQRLYKLARQGKTVERKPKRITVHDLHLVVYDGPTAVWPGGRAVIDILCSSGTYVRTLCATVGRNLGTAAYMSYLLRYQVGPFSVNQALTLEELERVSPQEVLLSLRDCLPWMPELHLSEEASALVGHGTVPEGLHIDDTPPGLVRLIGQSGELAAIGRVAGHLLDSHGHRGEVKLEKVFAT